MSEVIIKIKKKIYDAVSTMDVNELILLYDQIRFLEKMKTVSANKKQRFSI